MNPSTFLKTRTALRQTLLLVAAFPFLTAATPWGTQSSVDITNGRKMSFKDGQFTGFTSGPTCDLIQGALNPFLINEQGVGEKRAKPGKQHTVSITGRAKLTCADLHPIKVLQPGGEIVQAPANLCAGLRPGGDFVALPEDGFPISDGSNATVGAIRVNWDARIEFDYDANKDGVCDCERPILWQVGDEFWSGAGGGRINGGVVERGLREFAFAGSTCTDPVGNKWPLDRVVALNADTFTDAPTGVIYEFYTGASDVDITQLARRIEGGDGMYDDQGILQIDSWGMRAIGGLMVRKTGVGIHYYGHIGGTVRGITMPYMSLGRNVVFGDGTNGGARMFFSQCAKGGPACESHLVHTSEVTLDDCTLEGTGNGNVIVFGGVKKLQVGPSCHVEGGASSGHNVLLGAGVCRQPPQPAATQGASLAAKRTRKQTNSLGAPLPTEMEREPAELPMDIQADPALFKDVPPDLSVGAPTRFSPLPAPPLASDSLKVCAFNSECPNPTEYCAAPPPAYGIHYYDIDWAGGLSSDAGSCKYDSLVFGPGFKKPGAALTVWAKFSGPFGPSRICNAEGKTLVEKLFSFNPVADAPLDLRGILLNIKTIVPPGESEYRGKILR